MIKKIPIHISILTIVLIIHAVLVIISMNQPFQGDEVVFPACAKNYLSTGKLEFNFSSLAPAYKCLWHPPLYINLMAGSIYLFGDSVYAIRGISAIFNFFTIILIYLTTKELLKIYPNKEIIGVIAAALYALNPLVIQSSVAVDIDGGILNFFIMLFLLFFIKEKGFFWLVPSLFMIFWSKFAGIIIMFPVMLIYYIYLKDWKGIKRMLSLFIITGVIFIASFYLYGYITNADIGMTFIHNFAGRSSGFLSYLGVIKALWSLKSFVYFAVPFLILLFLILTLLFHKSIFNKEISKPNKYILLYNILAIFIILFYTYLKGTSWLFPKYFILVIAPLSIFVCSFIRIHLTSELSNFKVILTQNKKIILKLFILFLLLTIYFKIFIGDPLIPEFDETKENADILIASLLIMKSFSLYVLIPFLFSFLIINNMNKKGIIITLIFLSMFFYIYIAIVQATADYSTYSRYGDAGVKETIDYINYNNITAKEVAGYLYLGYYIGISEYTDISIVFNNPLEFKEKIVNNEDINYIVIFNRDIKRIGENMKYFEFEKQFGGNYIFKKK